MGVPTVGSIVLARNIDGSLSAALVIDDSIVVVSNGDFVHPSQSVMQQMIGVARLRRLYD